MAWTIVGKEALVAIRHLGHDVAGFGGIFVSGKCELEDIVSDFGRDFEKQRGGLGVCGERLFCVACFLFAQSRRSMRRFGLISLGARLDPVRGGRFSPGHCLKYVLIMKEQMLGCGSEAPLVALALLSWRPRLLVNLR